MTKNGRTGAGSPYVYAVQCAQCQKWRKIPSLQEFEEIRCNVSKDPFVCNKRMDKTCEDPGDIEYNSSRTWVMDKADIPKSPPGFTRVLHLRRDYSKLDASYITPEGKRLRSSVEAATFLEENPVYKKSVSLSDFSFVAPKVMPETIPKDAVKKTPVVKKIVKKVRKSPNVTLIE